MFFVNPRRPRSLKSSPCVDLDRPWNGTSRSTSLSQTPESEVILETPERCASRSANPSPSPKPMRSLGVTRLQSHPSSDRASSLLDGLIWALEIKQARDTDRTVVAKYDDRITHDGARSDQNSQVDWEPYDDDDNSPTNNVDTGVHRV